MQATSSNPYDWGSWQIKSRSDQLPLSAFAKENHIFPTAVTVCHRQTFNPENMNENAVNLANYSIDFWQKRPSYFTIQTYQTWSNQQWLLYIIILLLVHTGRHCFPMLPTSKWFPGHTSRNQQWLVASEGTRWSQRLRVFSKKQHKQRRLKESAAAILKYLKIS